MSNLKWIFDAVSASGKVSGGDSFVERLNNSKLNAAELFIRETVSNSADQGKDGSSAPVKIFIDVISLHGEHKEKFKKALNWDNLSQHAQASATDPDNNELHERIQLSLTKFNTKKEAGPIRLVRISDYNANGLTGEENDKNGNFFLFAKAQLLSSQDKNTQGSFGLGKGVLYNSSNLRTVLMSSSIMKDEKMITRVFGRCELPHHDYTEKNTNEWNPNQAWDGSGFFGVSDEHPTPKALSSSDVSNSILEDLFLGRDEDLGTGTTALCVDFNSDEDPSNMVNHLCENIRKWFWPALAQADEEAIQIYTREFNNNLCLTSGDGKVLLNEIYSPWADVLMKERNSKDLSNTGSIIQSQIKTAIPRDNKGSSAFEGTGDIKIIAAEVESSLANKIALLRNKLCVVKYEKLAKPDEINGNLFGVYLAGFARPNVAKDDDSFHQFLRLAEPALHDDWTEKVKVQHIYKLKGVQKFLKNHKDRIIAETRNMLLDDSDPKKTNHDHLSAKFKFGSRGGPERLKTINFKCINQNINKNLFEVTLKISSLIPLDQNWQPLCTLQIRGYKGNNNNLSINNIFIINPAYQNKIAFTVDDNFCSFNVDSDIDSFEVQLIAEIPKDLMLQNSRGKSINPEELTYTINVTSRS